MWMRITTPSIITETGVYITGQMVEIVNESLAAHLIQEKQAVEIMSLSGAALGYWHVEPEWKDQTVCIIGGGPSLTKQQVAQIRHSRVIAVNNTVYLAPWADILYFCDSRWYEWHESAVKAFAGRRVTLENLQLQAEITVYSLRNYGIDGMPPARDGIMHGRNSGFQAMQLAILLGVKRIILLGFDMHGGHWHAEHPIPTPTNVFAGMIDCFYKIAPDIKKYGVEVINCTPDTALHCFPCASIDNIWPA